jgi:hypothetical protein
VRVEASPTLPEVSNRQPSAEQTRNGRYYETESGAGHRAKITSPNLRRTVLRQCDQSEGREEAHQHPGEGGKRYYDSSHHDFLFLVTAI